VISEIAVDLTVDWVDFPSGSVRTLAARTSGYTSLSAETGLSAAARLAGT